MQTSQETTQLFKAMIEAAPDVQSISKSKQGYGYKYATLDSLIDMLRSALPKHGIWFIQTPTCDEKRIRLTTRVIHTSGEWMEECIEVPNIDNALSGKVNDVQKAGAAITYLRRYTLSSVFGVASDEDVDGNVNTRQQLEVKRQVQPVQTTPQPPKQKKMDPQKFVLDDYEARKNEGETIDSILQDYASLLKCETKGLKDYTDEEMLSLARALYNKNKA